MARTTFFVQLQADIADAYGGRGNGFRVRGLHARRLTSRYPRDPMPGAIVARLTVEIPDAALLPLEPEAVIEIPIDRLAVVVTAEPVPALEGGDE